MNQLDLFNSENQSLEAQHQADLDLKRSGKAKHAELERVLTGIKKHVMAYRLMRNVGDEFLVDDMCADVRAEVMREGSTCQFDSPRRIMTELRKDKLLNYETLDSKRGIWKFIEVEK